MYTLLEQALQRVPGQQQQQQHKSSVDVAAIMEQATRECLWLARAVFDTLQRWVCLWERASFTRASMH
jgi:hypothetical protein